MDDRVPPRTVPARRPAQRPVIERHGNLLKVTFSQRPAVASVPTTGWYHAEAIRDEAERLS